jgi:acyl-CoA reductase-like NAD-dependent aldehyde dehydrogenase
LVTTIYGAISSEKPFQRDLWVIDSSEKDVEQIVEAARQFYRLARTRAATLAQKTLDQMRERGESVAALVAGGFLTGPIQAELDRNDVSFMALVPQTSTTSQQDDDVYARLIVNR